MRRYGNVGDYGPTLPSLPATPSFDGQTCVVNSIPYIAISGSWVNATPSAGLTPLATPSVAAPTLSSPWQAFSGTTSTPAYYKDNENVVVLKGFLGVSATAATGSTICTLPVGYRPSETVYFPAPSRPGSTGTAIAISIIQIDSNGVVSYAGNASIPAGGYLSLEAVRFVAAGGPTSFGVLPPRPIFYRQTGASNAFASQTLNFDGGLYRVDLNGTLFTTTASVNSAIVLNIDGSVKSDIDGTTVQAIMFLNSANVRHATPTHSAVVSIPAGSHTVSGTLSGGASISANASDRMNATFSRVQ